jgi:hypothetical protein
MKITGQAVRDQIDSLSKKQLQDLVWEVAARLWFKGEWWDSDKVWTPETTQDIANDLTEGGIGPVAEEE